MTRHDISAGSHSVASWRSARLRENDEQCQRGDQQQFIIVDVGDDLRLLRDQRIEGRSAGRSKRAQEVRDARVFERTIDRGDICGDVGVVLVVGRPLKMEIPTLEPRLRERLKTLLRPDLPERASIR